MNITLVQPCIGRKADGSYIRSWCMEPLAIGVLSALTPPGIGRVFHDDRLEPIPYDRPTDLVGISVETYTARRAYQIADRYRAAGVPVVLGGFHPTLCPDEAAAHANAVVVGPAEPVWQTVLEDAARGCLQPRYLASSANHWQAPAPDRRILAGRRYAGLTLVETSRGCPHACEFCSIAAVYQRHFVARPVPEVLAELEALPRRNIFFVDDNFGADRDRLRELLQGIADRRLGLRWFSQTSLAVADDEEILRLMRRSGCLGVLVGFESLDPENLRRMDKHPNRIAEYAERLARLRRHGIAVYGTFVFGYGQDNEDSFRHTLDFAVRHRLLFGAFNHLVPFPGTPVYQRLLAEDRMLDPTWWLSPGYRFGDVAFRPRAVSAERLAELCYTYRQRFYSPLNILRRGMDLKANCRSLSQAAVFFAYNFLSRCEVRHRQRLPLGVDE